MFERIESMITPDVEPDDCTQTRLELQRARGPSDLAHAVLVRNDVDHCDHVHRFCKRPLPLRRADALRRLEPQWRSAFLHLAAPDLSTPARKPNSSDLQHALVVPAGPTGRTNGREE